MHANGHDQAFNCDLKTTVIQKGFKSNWYVFGAQMPQM